MEMETDTDQYQQQQATNAFESSQQQELQQAVGNVVVKALNAYVGFASLPNQVHRKSVKKGFNFTLMVVGESGLGKSTLINTLFETNLFDQSIHNNPHNLNNSNGSKTVEIKSLSAQIEENGVKLNLSIVDTPGFGDCINNDMAWNPIVDCIEDRFQSYLDQESRVNRKLTNDERIHACIYFIQPTGHSLKEIDLEFMRRLHTKVNLIPVIAKADTLTDQEISAFKTRILADIDRHGIQIFKASQYDNDDEETIAENHEIMSKIPFAVVGSTKEIISSNGDKVRGRQYPWGIIEVDNEDHCDFVKLRQMLIRTHMEELREHTNKILYETWRHNKLISQGVTQDQSVFKEVNPAAKYAEEKALHEAKLAKMESDMKTVFHQKVAEKEQKLKQSEEDLYARHAQMKENLERQRLDLEERKRRIEGTVNEHERASTKKRGAFNLGGGR